MNQLPRGWGYELATGLGYECPLFAIALVQAGELSILNNDEELHLKSGDIHCYAPGMPSRMLRVSEDYKGLFCSIDEQVIKENSLAEHFVRSAYLPIASNHKPQAHLDDRAVELLSDILRSIRSHISYDSPNQRRNLVALSEILGSNLSQILSSGAKARHINSHTEELFLRFLELTDKHYFAERSLTFYAQKLSITTTYLSKIVRQFSGRTVMSIINFALWRRAAEELSKSPISINELADKLGFADQASFSKFFAQVYGSSPTIYRERLRKPAIQ